MNNFRNRFANFMRGRNGVDYFSRFLLWAAFILILLSLIPHLWFLDYIGLALIIYSYFRIFSRNIAKRSAENRTISDSVSASSPGGGESETASGVWADGQKKPGNTIYMFVRTAARKSVFRAAKARSSSGAPNAEQNFRNGPDR